MIFKFNINTKAGFLLLSHIYIRSLYIYIFICLECTILQLMQFEASVVENR